MKRNCYGKYPKTDGFPCIFCGFSSGCMQEGKYFLISNKHADGKVITFWKSDNSGYTTNFEEAGVYELDNRYPLITKDSLSDMGKHETFFLQVGDIDLLGKRITCVRVND